jgi:hypothetical protein
MARLALGGISPEYAKIYEGLTGKPDATINVGLEPQSQDGILEGLARQTIQPYRPGWAALPGVAASIVGGMAANELNNRRRARDRADDKLFRDQMGGGSQAAPYVPPKVSAPASPAPTTVTTYTKPTTVGEQSDADERRILQQNGVIPAPPSTAPGAQIAGSDLAGKPQQDSRANWNNGQVQLGGGQIPEQPAQNPLLGRIQAKKEEMRRIVAQNPNITASQRQNMLARMQKLEALEAQLLQGEYQYQRGEPDRELSRRVKEAQLERLLRERQHPTVQLYEAAKASGFDGSLMDFIERQNSARSAPALRERQHPTVQLYEAAKASGFDGSLMDFIEAYKGKQQRQALPSSVQEYEYARNNGYQGSYQDWVRDAAKAKSKPASMTPTVQKMISEADGLVNSNNEVINTLRKAIEINKDAWYGPAAKSRAELGSLAGMDGASATITLDNMITGQALESLKTIFGGMPTEGERKILLDIQGSVSQPPDVREKIYQRALAAAGRRLKINQEKAKSLRTGSYFSPDYQPPQLQYEQTPTNNGLPTLTPEQARQLAPGTRFRGTDGKEYIR